MGVRHMGYRNLRECIRDLEQTGELVRIDSPVDSTLEVSAIQRRGYVASGPALLFTQVKNCRFPLLGNLFGTLKRTRYLFRDTLDTVESLVRLKANPSLALKNPLRYLQLPKIGLSLKPKKVSTGPVLEYGTTIDQLPQIKSWPKDGGAFITLPQVYTEHPFEPGFARSNLGMYRIQISGNRYSPDEIGLHYQIHRGIGVHHTASFQAGTPLKVNIFVGGPPALTIAAIMPLPENLPELSFAGVLGGRRVPMIVKSGELPIQAEADFCITGTILPGKTLPEGPFGDHLGYYSLQHEFPVMKVEHVFHRKDAIWPFTSVGRPPQEDTSFGKFIHELTGGLIPSLIPGVRELHAVDAAGVHPLLLAVGSERYAPYQENNPPQELLTQANAILGQGQLSLAKYLFIMNHHDAPGLNTEDIPGFFRHVLERADWKRDLHFQTRTTIDTLDYSGTGLNEGSKVVIAARGPKVRELPTELGSHLKFPDKFGAPRLLLPGILVVQGPLNRSPIGEEDQDLKKFCMFYGASDPINRFPLIVIVDDPAFTTRSLNNFLWITFTRSNPADDIFGIDSFIHNKHWGCNGSLVIDARSKSHHAPALEEDPQIEKKVDSLGAPGGPLHGII